jgi:hypothetical protein
MPQTTAALAMVNAKIEFSVNGSSWTDISGSANSIEPAEQSGASGEAFTFQGETGVVTAGKTEPVELVVKVLYTETTGESHKVVRAQWQTSGRAGYLRWSPRGGTTGQAQFTTAAGVLTGFTWPGGSADDGKPVMTGFKLKVPSITESTVA